MAIAAISDMSLMVMHINNFSLAFKQPTYRYVGQIPNAQLQP